MMTKNDKVKLAIYENKNLSEEDKISMIILYAILKINNISLSR